MDLIIGQRYQAPGGCVTLLELTDYQARVQPEDGDDPTWIQRASLTEAPPMEEQAEVTIAELLDQMAELLDVARAKYAAGERE
jgi:hypothetical protein